LKAKTRNIGIRGARQVTDDHPEADIDFGALTELKGAASRHFQENYLRKFLSYGRRRLKLADDALEEIGQETAIHIMQNIGKFTEGGKREFWNWALAIFRFRALNWLKTPEQRRRVASDKALEGLATEAGFDSDLEIKQLLQQALAKLSPQALAIIDLKYLEEFSYDEICEHMNLNAPAVRKRLSRAKKELKLIISKQEGEDDR